MRSKTSFFNFTLFRKNMTRFWPIWAVYAAIWTLMVPVSMFAAHSNFVRYQQSRDYAADLAGRSILEYASSFGVAMAVVFGLLAAVAVFSYLFNSRSAGLMHTLPIRREGLFLTNYLSGLAFLVLPNLFISLVTLLVEAACGVTDLWALGMWLAVQTGVCLFFYSFAVFCAMFTGHAVAMAAFYGILNFLAVGLYFLLTYLISMFTFGVSMDSAGTPGFIKWLTPCVQLPESLYFRAVTENGVQSALFMGFQYVLAYAAIGLVLALLALLLYRVRHLETAGDVIAVPWAKPLFKFGFAFCAALCGGMLLYGILSGLFSTIVLPLTVFMVLSGAVGCLVAEMLLQKTFKVFRKGWKSCGIFCLAVVALMFGLSRDFFGTERWVPSAGDVTSVYVSANSFYPYDSADSALEVTDPELIAQILDAHQYIVDHRAALSSTRADACQFFGVRLGYTLSDGSFRSRGYYVETTQAEYERLGNSLLTVFSHKESLKKAYFPFAGAAGSGYASGYIDLYDTAARAQRTVELTSAQCEALAAAALEDVEAGRLGIRYLENTDPDRTANCAYPDLCLEAYYTGTDGELRSRSVTITPQFTATALLAAFDELGITTDTLLLLSIDQYVQMENGGQIETLQAYPATRSPQD